MIAALKDLGVWASVVITLLYGVGWLIRRSADRLDKRDDETRKKTEEEQNRQITDRPEFQEIVAKQAEVFMERQAKQIEQLLAENNKQRQDHAEERRVWMEARRQEREACEREIAQRDETIRNLRLERERLLLELEEAKAIAKRRQESERANEPPVSLGDGV